MRIRSLTGGAHVGLSQDELLSLAKVENDLLALFLRRLKCPLEPGEVLTVKFNFGTSNSGSTFYTVGLTSKKSNFDWPIAASTYKPDGWNDLTFSCFLGEMIYNMLLALRYLPPDVKPSNMVKEEGEPRGRKEYYDTYFFSFAVPEKK